MSDRPFKMECDRHKTDSEKDYGNCGYFCACFGCGAQFQGHKGDITCPRCVRIKEAKAAVIEAVRQMCEANKRGGEPGGYEAWEQSIVRVVETGGALIKAEQS